MSRLPSFSTESSGNAQLLQTVLIPRAEPTVINGISQWTMKVDLCNIGRIQADSVESTTISGGTASVIGDEVTGVAIAGAGSDRGVYSAKYNIAGFGVRALGEPLPPDINHGSVRDLVVMGESAAAAARNISTSVLIGTQVARQASNICGTVAIGDRAMYAGRGSNNVYIGTRSGQSNVGSGNVFIGNLAGSTDTATSNQLIIANQSGNKLVSGRFRTTDPLLSPGIAINTTLGIGYNFDVSSRARINGHLEVTQSSLFPGSNLIGGVSLSDTNIWTSGTISGVFSNGTNTTNRIGGVLLGDTNIGTTGNITTTLGTVTASAIRGGFSTSNLIGGVSISSNNIGTTGFIITSGTISGGTIRGELTRPNVIGGVSISNYNIGTTGFIVTSGTISGGTILGEVATPNRIGGVSISNYNIGTTGVIRTSGTISSTLVHTGTLSAFTAKAAEIIQSNAVGSVQIGNGSIVATGLIQGNGIQSTQGVIALGAGFSSPIGSTNTIGGVTLGPNGVITTAGNVTTTGTLTAGNITTGGTLTAGNIVTTGTITGTFAGTTTGTTTGTVTGVINNGSNTSNNIGGVILDNGRVYAQRSDLSAWVMVRDIVGSTPSNRVILDTSGGQGGRLRLIETSSNVVRAELFAGTNTNEGGKLNLWDDGFTTPNPPIQLVSRNTGVRGGEIRVADHLGAVNCRITGGSNGRISNAKVSCNMIGGVELWNGDLTLYSNTTNTFDIDGLTGRISNALTSSNRIGRAVIDLSGTNAGRFYLTDGTNDAAGVEMYANPNTEGGGVLILRTAGAPGLAGTSQLRLRSGGRGVGGQIDLTDINGNINCTLYGDSGEISTKGNLVFTNPTSEITKLPDSPLVPSPIPIVLLRYLTLGHVYDFDGGFNMFSYNIQYTGTTSYRNVNSNRRGTINNFTLGPRVRVDIFPQTDASGTAQSYSNVNFVADAYFSASSVDTDRSYRAYFI